MCYLQQTCIGRQVILFMWALGDAIVNNLGLRKLTAFLYHVILSFSCSVLSHPFLTNGLIVG
jgi:hypothetical protein